jgi:hypothetical protein
MWGTAPDRDVSRFENMIFRDSQLQQCYDRNFVEVVGFSGELRQVCAALAVHDFFEMVEGPHSARVHETMELLTSPEFRPALREWYTRCGKDMNAAEVAFRDRLSQLTGETLGAKPPDLCNPS